MSLSGALTTAVTGLDVQSQALGAISNNVANSATSGYKRVETQFETLLSVANAEQFQPGGVISRPHYTNDIQGAIQQTSVTTNLAISGDGFFTVGTASGVTTGGTPIFTPDPVFTRTGDFNIDSVGFLKNSPGYYLEGWPIDQVTGAVQKNSLQPIRVTQFKDNPQPTQNVSYSANLPANPDPKLDTNAATPDIDFAPTQVEIFDAVGQAHSLQLGWTKLAGTNNTWTVTASSSDPTITVAPPGPIDVSFNVVGNAATGVQAGSIATVNGVAGAFNTLASLPLTVSFAGPAPSTQNVNLNFGKFGIADQTTMFTGTDVEFHSALQDGLAPGSFRSMSIDEHGLVTLNYDNGAQKAFFQIPVVTFSNPNGLQAQNGNAFSTSVDSGAPTFNAPGTNGSGSLLPSSIEGSNVDIASEFTKMIQTQSAYGANSKVITTTAQLLQITNDMVR
jgi:flagellar hook protein FlgE